MLSYVVFGQRFVSDVSYIGFLPNLRSAKLTRFKLFYASRIPLQCALVCTEISQAFLCIRWIDTNRRFLRLGCIILVSVLGVLSITTVAVYPFTKVSTGSHLPAHKTHYSVQAQIPRGVVVTTAIISNEVFLTLILVYFARPRIMNLPVTTVLAAWTFRMM